LSGPRWATASRAQLCSRVFRASADYTSFDSNGESGSLFG